MDLNQIEQWTRQALEAEAIRRGIRDPHLRTSRDLVRTILRQELSGPLARGRQRMAAGLRVFEQARGLIDAATVVAAAFWPAQFQALRGQTQPVLGQDESAPATELALAVGVVDVVDAAPEVSARLLDPNGGVAELLPDEPVNTLSMARLLAAQGHRDRALAVYATLLADNSLDPVLVAEAAALRAGESPVWQERVERLRNRAPSAVTPEQDDCIEWEDCESGGFTVRWRVSVAGEERARAVLGEAGERVLRLVTISPDEETVVRSEVREHAPVDAEGDFRIGPLSPDSRCHVAVGLRGGRRFVSITHVSPGQV